MSGSGVKISDLPEARLPLADGDELVLVQNDGSAYVTVRAPYSAVTANLSNASYYQTLSDARAANVPLSADFVQTGGYYAVGDFGGALYVRATAQPPHAGWFSSSDNAIWVLFTQEADARQFGAIGNDGVGGVESTFDDQPALQDALNWSSSVRLPVRFQPQNGGRFRITTPLYGAPAALVLGNDDGAISYVPGVTAQDPPSYDYPRSLVRADFGVGLNGKSAFYIGPKFTARGITLQGFKGQFDSDSCVCWDTREYSGLRWSVTSSQSVFSLPYSMPASMRVFVNGSETFAFTVSGVAVRNWYPAGANVILDDSVSNSVVSISPNVGGVRAKLFDCSAVSGYRNLFASNCNSFECYNFTAGNALLDNVYAGPGCTDNYFQIKSGGAGRYGLFIENGSKITVNGTVEQSYGSNVRISNSANLIIDLQVDVASNENFLLGLVSDSIISSNIRRCCYDTGVAHIRFFNDCWDVSLRNSYQEGVRPDDTSERVKYVPIVSTTTFSVPFSFPSTNGLSVQINGQTTTAYTISGTAVSGVYPAGSSVVLNSAVGVGGKDTSVVIYLASALAPNYIYAVDAGVVLTQVYDQSTLSAQAVGIYADAYTEGQLAPPSVASTHPGYRVGAWYGQPVTSTANGTVVGGAGGAANSTPYAHPIEIERDVTIDRLGTVVGVSAAGVSAKYALYASDPLTGTAGDLVVQTAGTASMSITAGTQSSAALASPTLIRAGSYWAAFMANGAAQPVCFNPAATGASLLPPLIGTPTINGLVSAAASTGITKIVGTPVDFDLGFPATFPSPVVTANTPGAPYVAFRIA